MARSYKNVPIGRGTSEWTNSKTAKKKTNKVVRRYEIKATIEYTEEGDPYTVYEDNVITRSQVHKIKVDMPPRIWDVSDNRSKVKEYANRRNLGDHEVIDAMREIIHAYMK